MFCLKKDKFVDTAIMEEEWLDFFKKTRGYWLSFRTYHKNRNNTKKLVEIIVKKFNSVQIFLVLFNETSRTENEYNCKKTLLKIFARLILVDLSVLELRLPLLLERDDDERHEDVDEEEREHDEEDDVEDRHLRPGTFSKYALLLLNNFHHLALEEGKGFIVTPNVQIRDVDLW